MFGVQIPSPYPYFTMTSLGLPTEQLPVDAVHGVLPGALARGLRRGKQGGFGMPFAVRGSFVLVHLVETCLVLVLFEGSFKFTAQQGPQISALPFRGVGLWMVSGGLRVA